MTILLRVEESDPTPPYEQLRRQLAVAVESGALAGGTRLPSVRQLAADLTLATGTVARAYTELERAGLVQSRRGAGTTVVQTGARWTEADRSARAVTLMATAVHQARLLDVTDEQIRIAFKAAMTGNR